jgi:hypothetical protein
MTLAERLAELAAKPILEPPPGHDRRGFYAKDDPAPPRSSCVVQRTPYIED